MIRFSFYCFAALTGLLGFLAAVWKVADDLLRDTGASGYRVDFAGVMLLFLSMLVLIGVHLAHRLANAFELPSRNIVPDRPISDVSGTPWEKDPGFTER